MIRFFSATYKHKQTLRNRKQKVLCIFKIETPDSLDVEKFFAWLSKAYRFELDDKGENDKLNGETQAAIQSANVDTYIDCWDNWFSGKISIEITQK